MLNFFIEKSFHINFYKINDDLSPDWKSIKSKLTKDIKFLLLINFFGYPQNYKQFKKIAKQKEIILIEDNAHGYGGIFRGKELGTFCDIGISSPHKTVKGLYSGGVLYGNYKINNIRNYKPNIYQKIKNIIKLKFPSLIFIRDKLGLDKVSKKINFQNLMIDEFSLKKIKSLNFKEIKNRKRKYFINIKNILKMNNINVINSNYSQTLNPWFLIIKRSSKYEKKLIKIASERKIKLLTWPALFQNKKYKYINKLRNKFYFIDLSFSYDKKKFN